MEEIRELVGSDHDRVHQAWDREHARLWRSVLAWSGDPDIASDAVAEAFAQALRRGGAIEDVDSWVWRAAFRIAGGLLKDRARRDGRGRNVPDGESAPADELVAVLDALSSLRPTDRQIVVLSLVGGWPAPRVAEMIGLSASNVRVRLHRARARLRQLLEDDDA